MWLNQTRLPGSIFFCCFCGCFCSFLFLFSDGNILALFRIRHCLFVWAPCLHQNTIFVYALHVRTHFLEKREKGCQKIPNRKTHTKLICYKWIAAADYGKVHCVFHWVFWVNLYQSIHFRFKTQLYKLFFISLDPDHFLLWLPTWTTLLEWTY